MATEITNRQSDPAPIVTIRDIPRPLARAMEWASRRTGVRPMLPLDVIRTTAAGSLLFDATLSIEELGMDYTPLETALAAAVAEIRTG